MHRTYASLMAWLTPSSKLFMSPSCFPRDKHVADSSFSVAIAAFEMLPMHAKLALCNPETFE